MESGNTVLCGANAYEMKYYFNEQFKNLPESIKEELHILCVLFTEEVGGIFTIAFEKDGNVVLETDAEEDDIYYDEISSGLMVAEVSSTCLKSSENWWRRCAGAGRSCLRR